MVIWGCGVLACLERYEFWVACYEAAVDDIFNAIRDGGLAGRGLLLWIRGMAELEVLSASGGRPRR